LAVLVAGGTGYIGAHTVRILHLAAREVVVYDDASAKAMLGWTPKYGLDEVIETAWAWHSAHLDGYASK
jgi:UDP-glucose 4-epimerase